MIPVTAEGPAALPLPTAKAIESVAFVPAGDIDPLQMDAAYRLPPMACRPPSRAPPCARR
ncbi:hypothetical protein GCM10010282_27310 [Streptomyces roseolus]|nr:hypothetical protein GCM10010282_27310 [Streptomyces roseolus]